MILHRCGDVPFLSKVGKEGADFGSTYLGGMSFVVEKDGANKPIFIGLFGAVGVALHTKGVLHLFKDFFSHGDSLTAGEEIV